MLSYLLFKRAAVLAAQGQLGGRECAAALQAVFAIKPKPFAFDALLLSLHVRDPSNLLRVLKAFPIAELEAAVDHLGYCCPFLQANGDFPEGAVIARPPLTPVSAFSALTEEDIQGAVHMAVRSSVAAEAPQWSGLRTVAADGGGEGGASEAMVAGGEAGSSSSSSSSSSDGKEGSHKRALHFFDARLQAGARAIVRAHRDHRIAPLKFLIEARHFAQLLVVSPQASNIAAEEITRLLHEVTFLSRSEAIREGTRQHTTVPSILAGSLDFFALALHTVQQLRMTDLHGGGGDANAQQQSAFPVFAVLKEQTTGSEEQRLACFGAAGTYVRGFNLASVAFAKVLEDADMRDLMLALRTVCLSLRTRILVAKGLDLAHGLLDELLRRDMTAVPLSIVIAMGPVLKTLANSRRFPNARRLRLRILAATRPRLGDITDFNFPKMLSYVTGPVPAKTGVPQLTARNAVVKAFTDNALERALPHDLRRLGQLSEAMFCCQRHANGLARRGIYAICSVTPRSMREFLDIGRILLFASMHVFFEPGHGGYNKLLDVHLSSLAMSPLAVRAFRFIAPYRVGLLLAFGANEQFVTWLRSILGQTSGILIIQSLRIVAEGHQQRLKEARGTSDSDGKFHTGLEPLLGVLMGAMRGRISRLNQSALSGRGSRRSAFDTLLRSILTIVPYPDQLPPAAHRHYEMILEIALSRDYSNTVLDFMSAARLVAHAKTVDVGRLMAPASLKKYTPAQLIRLLYLVVGVAKDRDQHLAALLKVIRVRHLSEDVDVSRAEGRLLVRVASSSAVVGNPQAVAVVMALVRWLTTAPADERNVFTVGNVVHMVQRYGGIPGPVQAIVLKPQTASASAIAATQATAEAAGKQAAVREVGQKMNRSAAPPSAASSSRAAPAEDDDDDDVMSDTAIADFSYVSRNNRIPADVLLLLCEQAAASIKFRRTFSHAHIRLLLNFTSCVHRDAYQVVCDAYRMNCHKKEGQWSRPVGEEM